MYSVPLPSKKARQSRQHSNLSYKTQNIRNRYTGDRYGWVQIRE